MSQLMSTIGSWVGKNTGILNTAATGVGTLANFLQGRKQNSYNDAILANEQQKQAILNDPAKMAAKVASFRHPLDQGLVSGVGNATQGYLAERGLSAAPTIQEQVMAQALGPFVNQNENTALMAALQSLGIPYAGMQPKFATPINLQGVLQSLLKGMPGTSGTIQSAPSTAGLPMPKAPDIPMPSALPPTEFTDPIFSDADWSSMWNLMPSGSSAGGG
jgi:hypothetical protein